MKLLLGAAEFSTPAAEPKTHNGQFTKPAPEHAMAASKSYKFPSE